MNNWTSIDIKVLEQIRTWLSHMQSFAVLLPQTPSSDTAFAAAGLVLWLKSLGKNARVVCSGEFPFSLSAFGAKLKLSRSLIDRQLIIAVNIAESGFDGMMYQAVENRVDVILEAAKGHFIPEDLKLEMRPTVFDAAIVLDARQSEQLGSLFFENPEFLENIPKLGIYKEVIINSFTQLTISKPTAVASSQIISELVATIAPERLDSSAATLLYTGLSIATRNFQSENVSTASLSCAAWLLEKGASQQQAALHLYPKQPLEVLKLFGKVLEILLVYPEIPAAFAIFEEDFGMSVEDFGHTLWDLQGWLGGDYPVMLGSLDKDERLIIVASLHDSMDTDAFASCLGLESLKFSVVGALNIFSAVSNLTPSEVRASTEMAFRAAFGML